MSTQRQPDEGWGCAAMILAAAIAITLLIWAGKDFPKFWQ